MRTLFLFVCIILYHTIGIPCHTHTFNLNPGANGGEAVSLSTTVDHEGLITHQTLEINSYGNTATVTLGDAIMSPEVLRRIASDMEKYFELQQG
jgi:hypothetical protein